MNFSSALENLKQGNNICRSGWNGKGMYLFLVKDYDIIEPVGAPKYPALPYIAMKTADDKVVPWLASQTDILAEDWMFV